LFLFVGWRDGVRRRQNRNGWNMIDK